MVPETEPVSSALPAAAAKKEVEPRRPCPDEKDDPTISGLLNSLADGSFRKVSPYPSPKFLVLIIAVVLGIVAAGGAGGYWYLKNRVFFPVHREAAEETAERAAAPFVIEKTSDTSAGAPPPAKNMVKKKVKTKRDLVATPGTAAPGVEKVRAADHNVAQAQKKQQEPQRGIGSWLNRTPSGPHATPPSRDPKDAGY